MATTRTTVPDQRSGEGPAIDTASIDAPTSEWTGVRLRPVAHWVLIPTSGGGARLSMVWEVPDPIPLGPGA